jgi:hypothetical protein
MAPARLPSRISQAVMTQATTGAPLFYRLSCHHLPLNNHRYMYSLVFAADMYATVFKKDPLDPALGQRYRETILRVGGSREETESLKVRSPIPPTICHMAHRPFQDFLGRPPTSEAFLRELFGTVPASNL